MDKAVVEREYAIQKDLALQSGKPEAVVEKMMEGRMRKYYEETVLLQQTFVMDNETQISASSSKRRPRTWARRSRLTALSASRWARASRRPIPILPTKSPRWQAPRPEFVVPTLRQGWGSHANLLMIRSIEPPGSAYVHPTPNYRRVLLKVSGEALMGDDQYGINTGVVDRIARDVKQAADRQRDLHGGRRRQYLSRPGRARPRASTAPPPITWACWRP